jgi:hypothetical protein
LQRALSAHPVSSIHVDMHYLDTADVSQPSAVAVCRAAESNSDYGSHRHAASGRVCNSNIDPFLPSRPAQQPVCYGGLKRAESAEYCSTVAPMTADRTGQTGISARNNARHSGLVGGGEGGQHLGFSVGVCRMMF